MLAKIIFFTAVIGATLAVILLAFVSPSPHSNPLMNKSLAISLYVLPPHPPNPLHQQPTLHSRNAFIFHHKLTEGPRNTSRIIGRAQGFVLPVEHLALAAFNIIYLTFDTPEYSGSLGVEMMTGRHGARDELMVVGGTGSFAFARGAAVVVQTANQESDAGAAYYIKLRLRLRRQSRTTPA